MQGSAVVRGSRFFVRKNESLHPEQNSYYRCILAGAGAGATDVEPGAKRGWGRRFYRRRHVDPHAKVRSHPAGHHARRRDFLG